MTMVGFLTVALTLGSAVVPLAPEHLEVRAALQRGDVDAAALLLAADPAAATPGLTFRVLQQRDPVAACTLVKGLVNSTVADVARLHVALCAPDVALLRAVAAGPFRHDPRALQAASTFVRATPALGAVDVDGLLAGALDAPLPVFAAPQRQAAAHALATLLTRGSPTTRGQALLRLVDELPEQPEAVAHADVDAAAPARRLNLQRPGWTQIRGEYATDGSRWLCGRGDGSLPDLAMAGEVRFPLRLFCLTRPNEPPKHRIWIN